MELFSKKGAQKLERIWQKKAKVYSVLMIGSAKGRHIIIASKHLDFLTAWYLGNWRMYIFKLSASYKTSFDMFNMIFTQ